MSKEIIFPFFGLDVFLLAPLNEQRRQNKFMLAEQGVAINFLPEFFCDSALSPVPSSYPYNPQSGQPAIESSSPGGLILS